MNTLKNYTIRRVVLWILLTALALITATGGYAAFAVRDMNRQADESTALTQQAIFLSHATQVLQQGSAAEKAALINEIPPGTEWATEALSGSASAWKMLASEHLAALTRKSHDNSAQIAADRTQLDIVLIIALLAAAGLVLFCDCYLVIHLVKPVGDIRAHFRLIAQGDLTYQPQDIGRNCVGQMIRWCVRCRTAC